MLNTTLCHIEKDGKYLMLHRVKKENDLNRDKWVGIGGKFEETESPEQCNAREVFEETGLILNDAKYRCVVTFVSDVWESELMHVFTASDYTGQIKECDEGELVWVDIDKVYSLPIWEGDKIFLRLIENEDLPFFSLRLEYRGEALISAHLNGKEIDFKEYL
ncbi:MAG: 8-oxo-dGTP diphosphatase [Clostridia bacterium]|nr:8-oxo-dGTP diphosphatase [Clostridia bacterium]